MRYIVITGNVVDGSEFYGPFASATDASEWADNQLTHDDYWVADLRFPSRSRDWD